MSAAITGLGFFAESTALPPFYTYVYFNNLYVALTDLYTLTDTVAQFCIRAPYAAPAVRSHCQV